MLIHVESQPVGRVKREQDKPRADRKATVLYRVPRGQGAASRSHPQCDMTNAETWALTHGRFIGECVNDEARARQTPAHERAGLIRLGLLAIGSLPGGVVIENIGDLGDDQSPSRAAVCQFLTEIAKREVWYGTSSRSKIRQLSVRSVQLWRDRAGRTAVADALAAYGDAVTQALTLQVTTAEDPFEFFTYLGSGPLRGVEQARMEDERLQGEGWSDREIREYLGLYGYINRSGTVGKWYHEQLKKLRTLT